MAIEIRSTLHSPTPASVPFVKIAEKILGKKYELSLVLCGDTLAQKMNKEYRKKSYKPNVLSFPYSHSDGEIFLNILCAKREAKKFAVSYTDRVALLFVHGCFHLKGLIHGDTMERMEQKMLRSFGF